MISCRSEALLYCISSPTVHHTIALSTTLAQQSDEEAMINKWGRSDGNEKAKSGADSYEGLVARRGAHTSVLFQPSECSKLVSRRRLLASRRSRHRVKQQIMLGRDYTRHI